MSEVNVFDPHKIVVDTSQECQCEKDCHYRTNNVTDMLYHINKHYYGTRAMRISDDRFNQLFASGHLPEEAVVAMKVADRLLHVAVDMENLEQANELALKICNMTNYQKDVIIRLLSSYLTEVGKQINDNQKMLYPAPYDIKQYDDESAL